MPKATHLCPTPNRANACWWQRLLAAVLVRGDWLIDILQCQRGEDHLPFPTSSSGLIRPTHDLEHENPMSTKIRRDGLLDCRHFETGVLERWSGE